MRILAVVNQKGGCGKTTTAIQLAWRLAAMGRRTLLVDLDPQGHATLGLGIDAPAADRALASVLSRSGLDEDAVAMREIRIPIGERLHLAPTGVELAELEATLMQVRGGEERLGEHLAPLIGDTDRVVIDAPPSLGMLTLNALTAADEVLVPVEPSLFSLHGLARLVELTSLLEARNLHRSSLRIFLNAFDARTRFARRTLEEVRRTFPAEILDTTVRSSVLVREAASRGLPVARFARSAGITKDYEALTDEIERRAEIAAGAESSASIDGLVRGADGVYLTRHDLEPDRVRLAGDFNGWIPDSGVELRIREDGSWTKFVPLRPGRYQYKFVVDGKWVLDPLNPDRTDNDAGSANSVLEIGA